MQRVLVTMAVVRTYDTIVVGLGVMGLATAAELARRGARVLGIEQFGIPHARGSSHGVARVFRTAYFEHADYVPLLKRAHTLWRSMGEEVGGPLLLETGVLYGGPADSALIAGSLASARQHGLAVDALPADELARRFPQFALDQGMVALFEPAAGMLLAEASLNAFAGIALRHRAELRAFEPVMSWSAEGDGVRVTTSRGEYSAARLVFCGGAWSGRLLSELGLPLRVTRQVSAWIWPRETDAQAAGWSRISELSARTPFHHQVDVRLDYRFTLGDVPCNVFLDLHNAYGNRDAIAYRYSYDYRQRADITALPVFPFAGLRAYL